MRSKEVLIKQFKHDIASPLTVLKVMLEMNESISHDERKIFSSALNRMENIVSSLEKKEVCTKTNPYELISQVIDEKKIETQTKEIQYKMYFSTAASNSLCHLQSTEFKRVISNIFNNSLDAIGGSGFIKIRGELKNKKLKITITDNGRGIDSDSILKVLNLGFSSKESTGLGLYHANKSLNRWQGSLRVNSILNSGTKITLSLPTLPKGNTDLCTIQA